MTTSTAGSPVLGSGSTGIPRPSSRTERLPSRWIVTPIRRQCPAIASSIELSTTSRNRWWRPDPPVEPMYIAGRFRTASSPSRIRMASPE